MDTVERIRSSSIRIISVLAVASLIVACGQVDPSSKEAHEPAAKFTKVLVATEGGATTKGAFETTTAYLSNAQRVLVGTGGSPQSVRFDLDAPFDGYYELFVWYPQVAPGAGAISAELTRGSRSSRQLLDQSRSGGQWKSLGVFGLATADINALLLAAPAGTRLYADSVRLQWIGDQRPALGLATTDLPIADQHDEYDVQFGAWGGSPPFYYRLVEGRLPEGLEFDGDAGRIFGAASETGEFQLQLAVTDGDGRVAIGDLTLHVASSADTPSSAPPNKLTRFGGRKVDLDSESAEIAALGELPAFVRALPEGSWAKLNRNSFSDVWVPADLRPLYGSSNPTPAKIITAWSSFAWDSNRGNLLLYGGGHANYRGNEVYLWRAATQMWERASLPSEMRQDALGNWNAIDSADAAPASAHTYDNTLFFPVIDRMVVLGGAADSNGGHYLRMGSDGTSRKTGLYLFDPSRAHPDKVGGTTGSHVQRAGPWPEIVGGNMWSNREMFINTVGTQPPGRSYVNGCAAYTRENSKDVGFLRTTNEVFKFTITDADNPSSDVWQQVGIKYYGSGTKATCTYDPSQKILLRTATQTVPFVYWNLSNATPKNRDVTVVPADPTGTFMSALASNSIVIANCGLEHDPVRGNHKLWCGGGTIWQLTPPATVSPTGWSIEPLAPSTASAPDPTVANGVLGKWKYIENLDVFMALQDAVQGNVWIYKPVGWVDPTDGNDPINQPPSVAISTPVDGMSFVEGDTVRIDATATDPDGNVVRVEFFVGPNLIAQATSEPFTFDWIDVPAGNQLLTARATDNTGATATSVAVNISVIPSEPPPPNVPPSVALTSPASGSTFTQGQPISLVAAATDTDGAVQRVEFLANAAKIGESLVSPFEFTWTGAPTGSHELSAVAYDDRGASTTSTTVSVTVLAPTGDVQTAVIQRAPGSSSVVADVYLSSYSKDKNYGGSDALLELSQYNVLLKMAIFQSEGGMVPNGAVIESATLSIYKWTSYAMTYGLHRMLQPWSESSATWNQRLPGAPWGAPGGKVAGVDYASAPEAQASVGYDPGWLNFDITAHIQQLSDTSVVVNHGWRLQPVAGATSSLKRLYSSEYAGDAGLRPKLTILYRY